MGEKVERISGSFFRGFTVGGANILPVLTRRVDSLNTPASVDTAGPATYTAAQIGRGIILRDPSGAARTDVLPTAALLIAGVVVRIYRDPRVLAVLVGRPGIGSEFFYQVDRILGHMKVESLHDVNTLPYRIGSLGCGLDIEVPS